MYLLFLIDFLFGNFENSEGHKKTIIEKLFTALSKVESIYELFLKLNQKFVFYSVYHRMFLKLQKNIDRSVVLYTRAQNKTLK